MSLQHFKYAMCVDNLISLLTVVLYTHCLKIDHASTDFVVAAVNVDKGIGGLINFGGLIADR